MDSSRVATIIRPLADRHVNLLNTAAERRGIVVTRWSRVTGGEPINDINNSLLNRSSRFGVLPLSRALYPRQNIHKTVYDR
ncbi:MAG: hypothetical protein JWR76_169 [Mucilaginibacter sp.]|jgi:hypothetical protein|nr:hypothetical protein [Mucilaginibacter sp.]